jgi:hypothetical protein
VIVIARRVVGFGEAVEGIILVGAALSLSKGDGDESCWN